MMKGGKAMEEHQEKFVQVRVVTTSGIYPEAGFDRVPEHQVVDVVLKKADHHLHTGAEHGGLIAVVGGRSDDIARSSR